MHNESKIGGMLSIISGVIGILSISIYILGIFAFYYLSQNSYYYAIPIPKETMKIAYIFYGATGIIMFLLDVLAIIGGVFALKMKHWGWSLAGAISATLTFFPCGVAAIILISKSQAVYNQPISCDPNQSVKLNP